MEWLRRWHERARNDLLVAQRLFNDFSPKQLEICCYQCQQSVEKVLKAYLVFKDYDFPFVHDLRSLCLLCADFDKQFNDYLEDCVRLTPYATQARYPDNDEIEENEAESALRRAERIFAFVEFLINCC